MPEALKRLISPEYLVVSEPGPLGGLWILYVALALLFAAGLVAAVWVLWRPGRKSQPTSRRAWAWFELWICLAGMGTVVGRFLGWPGWSARIWPYSLAALALASALAYCLRHLALPVWLSDQFRILSLSPRPWARDGEAAQPLGVGEARVRSSLHPWFLFGLLVHLTGIGLVLTARYGWPAWSTPFVLLLILWPQAPLVARHCLPRLMTLTPLLGAYAATLLWLLYRWLGITVIGWQGLAFPNPMVSLFYVDGVVLAVLAFTLVCELGVMASTLRRPDFLWRWAAIGLLGATLAWASMVYFGKRTHGATASDPYAYTQMAVDLAKRGTFLHRFSLFEEVMPLNIAWAPLQPVGYHIPRNDLGDCPSVWPTGASVLLAGGYRLWGEEGLYVTTPLVALLALAATWALVQEALHGESKPVRYLTGALTVTLLATSPEHVDRLLVPMADAPAQLFTVLTLFFALRAIRQEGSRVRLLGIAGVCFAWAYWVRHTQLVLALPVILSVTLGNQTRKLHARYPLSNSVCALTMFSGMALLAALPDILFRWRVFGGPFATETTELHLMGLQHIGPVAWQIVRDALAAGEWGYLFPLALYGGYRLARDRRREAIVLASAFVAVVFVHLTYRSLRLRDLISLFPLLNLAVACGAVSLVRRVRTTGQNEGQTMKLGKALLPTAVIAWVILSLALARWTMIDNLWKRGWASFGYMRAEHRAAFDRLAELTPPQAVIGASLNAGAVMMYTGRDAIRPYDSWATEEWQTFLDAMVARERPIYLLDDGGLMAEFIAQQRTRYRLTPIAELEIPLFYTRDRETGWLYRLEANQ